MFAYGSSNYHKFTEKCQIYWFLLSWFYFSLKTHFVKLSHLESILEEFCTFKTCGLPGPSQFVYFREIWHFGGSNPGSGVRGEVRLTMIWVHVWAKKQKKKHLRKISRKFCLSSVEGLCIRGSYETHHRRHCDNRLTCKFHACRHLQPGSRE